MAHCKFSLIIFYLILFNLVSNAQVYPDHSVDSLLKSGIDDIINENYLSARNTFYQLDNKHPDIPLGKIYLAAVDIAESFDYAEPFNSELISLNLEQAREMAEKLLKDDSDNLWNNYFLALTDGCSAYLEALKGNWLAALSEGMNSITSFEKCMEIDTSFYEADFALGAYKYWASRKTEFINWLPFIEDEKEYGIQLLQKAIRKSSYNTYLAIVSLVWIYIDQEEYEEAANLAENAIRKYPHSRFFKWGLARAYEGVDIRQAVNIYYEILNSYQGMTNQNHVNEITLKHIMAQQYVKLGERNKALELCNEILNIKNLSDYAYSKLEDRLERVRKLKNKLSSD